MNYYLEYKTISRFYRLSFIFFKFLARHFEKFWSITWLDNWTMGEVEKTVFFATLLMDFEKKTGSVFKWNKINEFFIVLDF